jgi:hypothetical protein
MNHGGRHWIKGAEERMVNPETHTPGDQPSYGLWGDGLEPAYCSIGALKQVKANDLAIIALAELISPDERKEVRENPDEYSTPLLVANDVIIEFNDHRYTEWDDVRGVFTRAARRLADRARK